MSPESQERSRRTHWRKGHLPGNTRKIGEERVTKDGFVQVHVALRKREKRNDQWRMKHHIVWEEANGEPVPKGCNIVFADGDRRNFKPENLVCVSRADWAQIQRKGLQYSDADTLRNAIAISRLTRKVYDIDCSNHVCKTCGEVYKARFPHQARCDKCIGKDRRS